MLFTGFFRGFIEVCVGIFSSSLLFWGDWFWMGTRGLGVYVGCCVDHIEFFGMLGLLLGIGMPMIIKSALDYWACSQLIDGCNLSSTYSSEGGTKKQ